MPAIQAQFRIVASSNQFQRAPVVLRLRPVILVRVFGEKGRP
jgi:hypothetical protein